MFRECAPAGCLFNNPQSWSQAMSSSECIKTQHMKTLSWFNSGNSSPSKKVCLELPREVTGIIMVASSRYYWLY